MMEQLGPRSVSFGRNYRWKQSARPQRHGMWAQRDQRHIHPQQCPPPADRTRCLRSSEMSVLVSLFSLVKLEDIKVPTLGHKDKNTSHFLVKALAFTQFQF